MRLVIWHGYLLAGTGSNIYTQHVARAWGGLGHDVVVMCQEPHPERFDLGPRVRVVQPSIGPLLPVFVVDRYEGVQARHVADFSPTELDRYLDANADALAAELGGEGADLVLANHAIMGGPVAAAGCPASGTRFAVKLHGSELEYAIRGRPQLVSMAREPLDTATAVYAGSQHIVDVTRELLGDGEYLARTRIVPPGVDTAAFAPGRGSLDELVRLLAVDAGSGERAPDAGAGDRLRGLGRFVLYFGKLMRQKGVDVLLAAWRELEQRHPAVSLVVVGFGDQRAQLERVAPPRTIFTGAMDHGQLQRLVPLADAVAVPSVLAEAFGMVAAEAAACGVLPVVSDHSGLAEVADGLGEAGRRFDGTATGLATQLDDLLRMPAADRRALGQIARAEVIRRWSWETIAARLLDV